MTSTVSHAQDPWPTSSGLITDQLDIQRPSDIWLVTFSDLVLLLLTFMVLIFAMSTPDPARFQKLVNGAQAAFGVGFVDVANEPASEFEAPIVNRPPASDLNFLASLLSRALQDYTDRGILEVNQTTEYLVVSLPGDLSFAPGNAKLQSEAQTALFDLTTFLMNLDNQIAVSGHTDPSGIGNAPYLSNWELSLARAASVANALSEGGYQRSIAIFGRADADFRRLTQAFPGLAETDRYAAARRVDIIILPNISGT